MKEGRANIGALFYVNILLPLLLRALLGVTQDNGYRSIATAIEQ